MPNSTLLHTAVNTANAPSGTFGGQQSVTAPSFTGSGTSLGIQTPVGLVSSGQGVTVHALADPLLTPIQPPAGDGSSGGVSEQEHRVYQDFNNNFNDDISLTFTGSI